MSSKILRPIRLLPILAVLAACLSLPALASAKVTYSMKWNKSAVLVNPTKGDGLDSIGCSSTAKTNLCVAGDLHGNVWATAHPSRPGKGWRRETIDNTSYAITGVSCPTTTLCVAIDSAGQVLHSTKPLDGATAWTKPARIDTATQPGGAYAGLSAISCPTATLCVAVDNATNGQVAYTTTPNGPASSWHLVTIGQNVTLSSVSCSSATLCVIGGSERYYSTTPTGAASAWKATGTLSGAAALITSLSCDGAKLCVGVGYGNGGAGLASATSTPTGTTTAWTPSAIGGDPPAQGAGLVDTVSCPVTNFCVAADTASNVYTTATPVRGGWSAPKRLKKASQATQSQLYCNKELCVEVDNRGTATYGVVKASTGTPTTSTKTTTTTSTKTTTSSTKTG